VSLKPRPGRLIFALQYHKITDLRQLNDDPAFAYGGSLTPGFCLLI